MAEKTKDLFLDMLENPNLTLEDLASVGHSIETTRFLDKSAYENSQRVRDKFTDSNGNFKQDEFNQWYALAAKSYQELTDTESNLSLLNVTAFDESDITVSPEKRTMNTAPIVSFSPNPDRLSTSIYRVGKTSERELSQSELAQSEKILLNPVEAAQDPSKAKWGDSPNDSWWSGFFDTQVLAQWDEDGEHIDPVTKQKVTHKKGELKLNDNGTYYYEALDGRDVYGRQVLNKLNTITTDGSFWNQYDFFDSDDIKEKSFVGSVAKNLALVGSMFIPYVGWGIAGASIATQVVGLTGTLGKMLTGSDSPTFSAMEGWAKSLNRQTAKTEYAQQNMLCWENFIDLIGDVTAQLREQRAIFKFVPAILGKGKYGAEVNAFGANSKTFRELQMNQLRAGSQPNLNLGQMARAVGGEDVKGSLVRAGETYESIISQTADKAVSQYLKDYQKLGEQVARAYMVGITVGDTYGEAKQAGATDFEATMLTLGYAAAENALLKSELGRWIFPELKGERAVMSTVAKKLTQGTDKIASNELVPILTRSGINESKAKVISEQLGKIPQGIRAASEALGSQSTAGKLNWMKKMFNAGKEAFNTQKGIMKGTMGAMMANALAEGTEEVSEELLKDFSTSCFNLVKAAQGSDVRMQGLLGTWDWNEALKRYGMSFFGGLIGGGINSAAVDYKQFKDIANMTSEQAMERLVWMERNGEMDKFWDVVSKETLGNKALSTEVDENGVPKPGTPQNNQDLEVKRALRQQINMIHNVLTAEGASLNDDGLIGQIMNAIPADTSSVLGDFRANALAKSVTAGRFLKEYNKICSAIIFEEANLRKLETQTTDSQEPSNDIQNAIKESKEALKVLQEAKNNILDGKRTAEFYRDAMFETTYGVSEQFIAPTEVQYMEYVTGKPYKQITEEERADLKEQYATWSETERAEQIHALSEMFHNVIGNTSKALKESGETFTKIKDGQLKKLQKVVQNAENRLMAIHKAGIFDENPIEAIQQIIGEYAMRSNPLGSARGEILQTNSTLSLGEESLANSTQYAKTIETIKQDPSLTDQEKRSLAISAFLGDIHQELTSIADEILETKAIHPEVKRTFIPLLKSVNNEINGVKSNYLHLMDPDNPDLSFDEKQEYAQYVEQLNDAGMELEDKITQLEALNYTPISENLRNFAIGLDTDQSVLDLVELAINKEVAHEDAVDNIVLDDKTAQQFDEAEKLLKLYRASIVASRNDNADVDHIFGYAKILNELCHDTENWTELAEIDQETADLALQDINLALNRLDAIKGISSLNQGNKLNVQHYAAVNKNLILFNKSNTLITTLLNEDDDDAKAVAAEWNKDGAIDELKLVLDNMSTHKDFTADTAKDRTLGLNTQQKEDLEREQHQLEDAIYNFFQKNADAFADNDVARKKLAHFIRAAKLNLFSNNEDIFSQDSDTIDDNAYLWWLCGKAALKTSDFYKEYRKIISDDIAPIPTQEFGIYESVAALYNGNVFTAFGKAAKQAMFDQWNSMTEDQRKVLIIGSNLDGLSFKDADVNDILGNDITPNYYNLLFIEGIAGSGKTQAVLKAFTKFVTRLNPTDKNGVRFSDKPICVAHTTKENADDIAKNLELPDGYNVKTYGREDLLKWMSAEYVNRLNPETNIYEYHDEDVFVEDEVWHSKWKVRQIPRDEVPSVIMIDELSQYTQPELDLMQRFASEYGIQIIGAGDLDQLSPTAYYFKKAGDNPKAEGSVELSIARNMMARVPKLGISMRTGNGQKTRNTYDLINWKRTHNNTPLALSYVETGSDIWGDKVYNVTTDLSDAQVTEITADIDKMVANLRDGEKVGYIWHSKDTALYKLLSDSKYKDKIQFMNENAAQGREARYYIVENNRSAGQSDVDYHRSVYTGITRAEQASIVIAPDVPIGKLELTRPKNRENKLIPDNFTKDGVARFSIARRAVLNNIYDSEPDADLSHINSRTPESVPVTSNKPINKSEEKEPPSADPLKDAVGVWPVGSIISNGQLTGRITSMTPGADGQMYYNVDFGKGNQSVPESQLQQDGFQLQQPPAEPVTETKQPSKPKEKKKKTTEKSAEEPVTEESKEKTPTETAEAETPNTMLEVTPENLAKFINAFSGQGGFTADGRIQGWISQVALSLGVKVEDLADIITTLKDFTNTEFTEISPGVYATTAGFFNKVMNALQNAPVETEAPQGPPKNAYNAGDKFFLTKKDKVPIVIKEVIPNQNTGEFQYTAYWEDDSLGVYPTTLSESQLKALDEAGLRQDPTTVIKPDGKTPIPVTAETSQGQLEAQQASEEESFAAESDIEEIVETDDGDIEVKLLGHTWNTNYVGVYIDQQTGQPILPQQGQPGFGRIDMGNGLLRLNPEQFNSIDKLRQAIGAIRQTMMFGSNEEIIAKLQNTIPALKDQALTIQWAFISKAKDYPNRKEKDARFQYDQGLRLDYMEDDGHAEVPAKTISMLVSDANGNCVLEMPLMVLNSPFTALYRLGQINPDNPIYKAYKDSLKSGKRPYEVANDVIAAILKEPTCKNNKGRVKPGYYRLHNLLKLWNFTSDGIVPISDQNGKPFNMRDGAKTLGPKFVKNRTVELAINSPQVVRLNYEMKWHDLTEEVKRHDVNFSSIMMFTREYDSNWNKLGAAPGHLFVLRSDSAAYVTDEAMMKRYLEQLSHPELDPIVKLELVTPPETSISEYLEDRSKDILYHYGNEFTAYRLLSLIKKYSHGDIWQELSRDFSEKNKIAEIIDILDNIQAENKQGDDENHQQYLSRVFKLQKDTMVELDAVNLLSKALFNITYKYNYTGPNTFNAEIAQKIQNLCSAINPETGHPYLDGILYRPVCEEGEAVAGVGYRIKAAGYTNEDGKPYRIYSRYDTPIFDLSSLAGDLNLWANNYTVTGNVYRFNEKTGNRRAWVIYTAEGRGPVGRGDTPNQKLKKKYAQLLDKLGLKDYNRLDNINDELQFLEAIRDKYIETPGNIAVVANGTLYHAQLTNEGVNSKDKFDSTYATAIQENFVSNNSGDNSYTLSLKHANGNVQDIRVEIFPGNREMIFELGFPTDIHIPSQVIDYNKSVEALNANIEKYRVSSPKMAEQFDQYRQIIQEGVLSGKSHEEIIAAITGGKPANAILKRILGKEFFDPLEAMNQEEEVCPIRVHKTM